MAFQTVGLKPFMDYEIYVHNFEAQLEFFSEKEQNWIYQNISHIVKASVFM